MHASLFLTVLLCSIIVTVCHCQSTYVYEYAATDRTCSLAPTRVYVQGTTCKRGPILDRYGFATCGNNTVNSNNCIVCGSCTTISLPTNVCIDSFPSPTARSTPWKARCDPDTSVTTNPEIVITEFQDTFCMIPLQTYNQTKMTCTDNIVWKQGPNGVTYQRFSNDACTGTPTTELFMQRGFCKSVDGKNIKVDSYIAKLPNSAANGHSLLYILLVFVCLLVMS